MIEEDHRQLELTQPRFYHRPVANNEDRKPVWVDVLSSGPTDLIERNGLELFDLVPEVVIGQAVVNDVEEPAENATRALEARWIAPDEAESRFLKLIRALR